MQSYHESESWNKITYYIINVFVTRCSRTLWCECTMKSYSVYGHHLLCAVVYYGTSYVELLYYTAMDKIFKATKTDTNAYDKENNNFLTRKDTDMFSIDIQRLSII